MPLYSPASGGGGGAPSGAAGGDLSGTYPNPTVLLRNRGAATNPSRHHFNAWSWPPFAISSTATPAAGVMMLARIDVPEQVTIAQLALLISTAGTGVTPLANCFAAVFNSAGTRLGVSADQSSAWASTGLKTPTIVVDGGQSLTVGGVAATDYVFGAILVGTQSTTQLVFRGNNVQSAANVNLTAAETAIGTYGSGLAAIPSSLTPASIVAATSAWMATA